MKIRIKFSKHGAMKFIGHLDTMRYFQKVNRRSGIDVSYTGGFSPHQIMAFAAPLGVGLESDGEYVDLEVDSYTSSRQMTDALNDHMADGFRILDVRALPDDAPNAMASVRAASYRVDFREGREASFSLEEAVCTFKEKDTVTVTKQTKKSTVDLDLKNSVYDLNSDGKSVFMCVDASSSGNIKPELVIRALFAFYDKEPAENALQITRLETYGLKDNEMVPLIEFGSIF